MSRVNNLPWTPRMLSVSLSALWSLQGIVLNKDTGSSGLKEIQTFFLSVEADSKRLATKKKRSEEESGDAEKQREHRHLSL